MYLTPHTHIVGGLSQERKRAVSLRYEDPTNPTYESTTTMYHRVADEFLRHIQTRPGRVEVVIATHNEATVGHVLRQLVYTYALRYWRLIVFCRHV